MKNITIHMRGRGGEVKNTHQLHMEKLDCYVSQVNRKTFGGSSLLLTSEASPTKGLIRNLVEILFWPLDVILRTVFLIGGGSRNKKHAESL